MVVIPKWKKINFENIPLPLKDQFGFRLKIEEFPIQTGVATHVTYQPQVLGSGRSELGGLSCVLCLPLGLVAPVGDAGDGHTIIQTVTDQLRVHRAHTLLALHSTAAARSSQPSKLRLSCCMYNTIIPPLDPPPLNNMAGTQQRFGLEIKTKYFQTTLF
ncbi:hypothetical protein ElyMa_002123300 [Elysia marginata]|uniref:Uncharacterized protein n=1 Tax=Elysia marginata TaxID=1093978 RepID=A0AAV4FJB8_9GAST|nr:hypothetical protein ElyMa_002123300 [Elysia marginata]